MLTLNSQEDQATSGATPIPPARCPCLCKIGDRHRADRPFGLSDFEADGIGVPPGPVLALCLTAWFQIWK